MKRTFILCIMILAITSVFAQPVLSGSSVFSYTNENEYANVSTFDYSMLVTDAFSLNLYQSVGITDGVVTSDWPTLEATYSTSGFTITADLSSNYSLFGSYKLDVYNTLFFTPSVKYANTIPMTNDFIGTISPKLVIEKGPAYLPGLFVKGTILNTITSANYFTTLSGYLAYKQSFGDIIYIKPYISGSYINLPVSSFSCNMGITAAFITNLSFDFNYVLDDNSWALAATVTF